MQQGGEGAAHRSRVSVPAVEVDVPGRGRRAAIGECVMSSMDVVTTLNPSRSPCKRLGLGQERRSKRMVALEWLASNTESVQFW